MLWQRANRLTTAGETIAGFRLYPPTVGHCLLLGDLGIDLYGIDAFPDLLLTAFVLAHKTAEGAQHDLESWWCGPFMRWWGKRSGNAGNAERDVERFQAFLKANTSSAEVVVAQGKSGRTMGSPWAWRLYAALIGECGMTRTEALRIPILEAQLLTTALGEIRGNVELWTDRDQAFWDWCDEQDRLKENGASIHSGEAGA